MLPKDTEFELPDGASYGQVYDAIQRLLNAFRTDNLETDEEILFFVEALFELADKQWHTY